MPDVPLPTTHPTPAALLERFDDAQLRSCLQSSTAMLACPGRDCQEYYEYTGHDATDPDSRVCVRCTSDTCGITFCSHCKRSPYHYDVPCNRVADVERLWDLWQTQGRAAFAERERAHGAAHEHFEQQRQAHESVVRDVADRRRAAAELAADEQWKATNMRCCPHCQRPVQRIEGCSSMTCGRDYHGGNTQPGCGTSFNWNTARPYQAEAVADVTDAPAFTARPPEELRAQTHGLFKCDVCHNDIVGLRFRSIHSAGFNTCIKCEAGFAASHPAHVFEVLG